MAIIAQSEEHQIQPWRRSDTKLPDLLTVGCRTQLRRCKSRWNWVKIGPSRWRTGQQAGLEEAKVAGRIFCGDPTFITQPHIDSIPGEMFVTK
jgi:hypothetical protein